MTEVGTSLMLNDGTDELSLEVLASLDGIIVRSSSPIPGLPPANGKLYVFTFHII